MIKRGRKLVAANENSLEISTRVEKGQQISFVHTFIIPRLKNRTKLNSPST